MKEKFTATILTLLLTILATVKAQDHVTISRRDGVKADVQNDQNTGESHSFPEHLQTQLDSIATSTYQGGVTSPIVSVIRDYIEQGIDLNAQSRWGNSLLDIAIVRGDIESVKLLADNGVKIDTDQTNKMTPLQAAAYFGWPTIADYLISKGAKHDIFSAVALGLDTKVKELLEQDPSRSKATIKNEITPLMWAVYAGGKRDMSHFQPFWEGRKSAAELLIKHGADVNARSGRGEIVLINATGCRGLADFVELLLKHGAQVDIREPIDSWTPLFTAIWWQDVEKVKVLLKYGADVNVYSAEKETPLHVLARKSGKHSKEIAELLLAKGANIHALGADGLTPIDVATKKTSPEARELLEFFRTLPNVNANTEDKKGKTTVDLINIHKESAQH